jgi:3-methyladenine DNA glycosylase AlkD
MNKIIAQIKNDLQKKADPKHKQISQRFFKEKIKLYGVKHNLRQPISKKYWREVKNLPKAKIFALCEELLKSKYMEESSIAYDWSHWLHKKYEPKDFLIFTKWVNKYVSNWGECDNLCNHSLGAFIEKFPSYLNKLKTWTKSKNRWVKRASAVSLILPARKGLFLKDVFVIADKLMTDEDDLVQKGYGWLLKEASRQHPREIFAYVLKNKKAMPRTSLRYAIEKLPLKMRIVAIQR